MHPPPLWPPWASLPFALLLVAIALGPTLWPQLWARPRGQLAVVLTLSLPVLVWGLAKAPSSLAHAAREYLSFMALLGSLFAVTAGVGLQGGRWRGPLANACVLLAGAALASLMGTTGASMLLLPVLLRLNRGRRRLAHLGVLFICLVSNAGGLLLPLGDPPLFLGYLRGVPFFWTLRLWPVWLAATAYLVTVAFAMDSWRWRHDPTPPEANPGPLRLVGWPCGLLLPVVMATVALGGALGAPWGIVELTLAGIAWLAWRITPAERHAVAQFSWHPLIEVAILFVGIFITMAPAVAQVAAWAPTLPLQSPLTFFWATGLCSSLLDNAPTYLTAATVATSRLGLPPGPLRPLIALPAGQSLLQAISLGAVLMGAQSYIGNGPNMMVRAICERQGARMPGFVAYIGWASLTLAPLYLALTFYL